MTLDHDSPIRRRPDGSLDTDFYSRRAAVLRRMAIARARGLWARGLGRRIAALAGGPARRRPAR